MEPRGGSQPGKGDQQKGSISIQPRGPKSKTSLPDYKLYHSPSSSSLPPNYEVLGGKEVISSYIPSAWRTIGPDECEVSLGNAPVPRALGKTRYQKSAYSYSPLGSRPQTLVFNLSHIYFLVSKCLSPIPPTRSQQRLYGMGDTGTEKLRRKKVVRKGRQSRHQAEVSNHAFQRRVQPVLTWEASGDGSALGGLTKKGIRPLCQSLRTILPTVCRSGSPP